MKIDGICLNALFPSSCKPAMTAIATISLKASNTVFLSETLHFGCEIQRRCILPKTRPSFVAFCKRNVCTCHEMAPLFLQSSKGLEAVKHGPRGRGVAGNDARELAELALHLEVQPAVGPGEGSGGALPAPERAAQRREWPPGPPCWLRGGRGPRRRSRRLIARREGPPGQRRLRGRGALRIVAHGRL